MSQTLIQLKEADQDFEWYPTTDQIINCIASDMRVYAVGDYNGRHGINSILDIGAGDGRVLTKLKKLIDCPCDLMAIEKSTIHQENMDREIMIVGTDFREQQLAGKIVDAIFSNPPYSEFEEWAEKIIRESASVAVYLVIPNRWVNSERIKSALEFRKVRANVIGEYDFLNAERQARARVNVVRIRYDKNKREDSFENLFRDQFSELYERFERLDVPEDKKENSEAHTPGGKHRPFADLKNGPDIPDQLVSFYNAESAAIYRNFQSMKTVDAAILRELGVHPNTIMKALKVRLEEIKNAYWRELFSRIEAITRRLTHESREQLLKHLNKHMQVDFTLGNIYAVILWVIKNANTYMEQQIIAVYDRMIDSANVVNYKSNNRLFVQNSWREMSEKNSHFALEYRIVTTRLGGLRRSGWYDDGLTEAGAKFLGDLCTIACNLGFPCNTVPAALTERDSRKQWESGKSVEFFCTREGKRQVLFEAKAFLNGNMHLRFNKKFMLALNVEHGRLRGWINSAKEAVDELGEKEASSFWKSNTQFVTYNATAALTY